MMTETPTRAAVAVVNEDGYSVGYADRGVSGYTPTTYSFETYDEAWECAHRINEAWGLTRDESMEIALSSMRLGR